MDGQLYIRVRGRVLGPYDREKLKSLASRGQFSRLHEVSGDGVSWQRAAAFPDLFVAPAGAESATSTSLSSVTEQPPEPPNGSPYTVQPSPQPPAVAPRQQMWNYTSFGVESTAPVDFPTLQSLAAAGRLSLTDQVWTEGMNEWKAVSQVPGLVVSPSGRQGSHHEVHMGDSDAGRISDEACRALAGSRPWIVFISILVFLYSALTAIGAVFSFVAIHDSPLTATFLIASGVFNLIFAGVVAVAGFMLMAYAGRIRDVMYHRKMYYLESTLHAARVFWVYLGIVLIVLLAFVVIFLVWLFAIAGGIAALASSAS
jgi:hypothetical protein